MFDVIDKIWHQTLKRPYKLKYSEFGSGEPLVLLHGLGASREKWQPLIKLIELKKWQVLAPDLLGFGKSPKPQWSSYEVSQHAKSIIALIDQKKIDRPLTIAGHSMGCLVAVHIAATRPKLVKRLVLYQPPLFAYIPEFPKHASGTKRRFALFEFIASRPQLAFVQSRLLRKVYGKIRLLNLSDQEWVPFERSLKNTIMNQSAYDQLKNIDTKTDIIHGRFDLVVTKAEIKQMFAHNNKITLHKVADTHDITTLSSKYILKILEVY